MCDPDNQQAQRPTLWTYDARNQMLSKALPGHNPNSMVGDADYDLRLFSYDLVGRPAVFTDQAGDTVAHTFDLAGRLIQRDYQAFGQHSASCSPASCSPLTCRFLLTKLGFVPLNATDVPKDSMVAVESSGHSQPKVTMSTGDEEIQTAIERRQRCAKRMHGNRTPGERLEAFVRLQQASFHVLQSSPDGYRHFLRRNFHARRAEIIDGQWKPVALARRAQLP